MSREIKFRGLSHKRGWFYGDIVNTSTTDGEFVAIKETPYNVNNGKFNLIPMEIIQGTEGQYTGLQDKNGKEIFEGDIWDKDGFVGIVQFQNSRWECNLKSRKGMPYPDFYCYAHVGEIIGDIHTTPEFLGEA